MIEIITEYMVKPEHRARLELAFGPGGAWSSLFDAAAGFKGMTLLQDLDQPQKFLTIEVWESEDYHQQALAEQQAPYDDLMAEMDVWLDLRNQTGRFRMRAEGSVRPRGRSLRGR